MIRFLTAKNVSAAEIHRQMSDVYGPNVMSSGKLRKWVRVFNLRPEKVHDKPRSGRPSFGWEQIDRSPYSPDLTPSDFYLFRYLKEFLCGKRFATDDEMKETVQDWLSSQAADVCDLGIQKLVERYDKCLKRCGNNVEK